MRISSFSAGASSLCVALLLTACGRSEDPGPTAPGPDGRSPTQSTQQPGELPQGASIQVAPTQGNTVTGALAIAATEAGLTITGALQGLPPDAEFGFHIHERGDCSAPDASSAGEHFNPSSTDHGHPDSDPHHLGDMLNLKSNAEGVAQVELTIKDASLHGGQPTDVLGKAVVVHAKPDDYKTQPSGGSGDRIACGVIAATGSLAGSSG